MSATIKILHTADVHIGQKHSKDASTDAYIARCKRSSFDALSHLVDIAINNNVDAFILAGDTFHSKPSSKTMNLFLDIMSPLEGAGIQIMIVCGNHDGYKHWKKYLAQLPSNFHVFNDSYLDSFTLRTDEGKALCQFCGISLADKNCMDVSIMNDFNVSQADSYGDCPVHVGVLHIGASESNMTETVDMAQLGGSGFDYIALGHIHKPNLKTFGNTLISYSGTPQGHDIGEPVRLSEDGKLVGYFANLVTISAGQKDNIVSIEQVPSTQIIFDTLKVDITNTTNASEIIQTISTVIEDTKRLCNCQNVICRINLIGTTIMHDWLLKRQNVDYVIQNICSLCNINCKEIFIKTSMIYIEDNLLKIGGVPAEIIRQSNQLKSDPEICENYIQSFLNKNKKIPIDASVIDSLSISNLLNNAKRDAINAVSPLLDENDG